MSDIGSDTAAQLHMMRDAYMELRQKHPSHQLLALVDLHDDGMGFSLTPEYRRRCVRELDEFVVQSYARYTLALQAAATGNPVKLLDTEPRCEY